MITAEHTYYGVLALVALVAAIACITQYLLLRGAGEAEDYGELPEDWSPHR